MRLYTAKIYELQTTEEERLFELLDSDRREKVSEIRSRRERERSIFAGLLLRHAFLQAGNDVEAWRQAEIGRGAYGKPFIKGYQEFHYGLSHSGEWAVCVTDTMPVGVDIQEMKSWRPTLAKRFYHEEEYNRLLALGETDIDRQTQEFYIMWTAKESAVKLNGRGIGAGISQYVTDTDYRHIYDMDRGQTFRTRWYDILEGYIICVCSETGIFPDLPERVI